MKRYKLKIAPEALEEIQEVIDYYNDCAKGLGRKFYLDLEDQFALIKKNPFARAIRYDEVRFALLDRFPYAAHFTIDESSKTIQIISILSQYRDPDTHWKKRK